MSNTFPFRGRNGGVFIVGEAGVNHNGDMALAKRLIDAAAAAEADAVKFQTFAPGELTGRFTKKVAYHERGTAEDESRYELTTRLALPFERFLELQDHAKRKGILFFTTPDGFQSLPFVTRTLKPPLLKVASTEVTHPRFLREVAAAGLPVILSTGMSTLGEVEAAVGIFREKGVPLAVLHCTSEYPAPPDQLNLRAMTTIRDALRVPVGYSDHSSGSFASIVAVALGACVIEKHFTTDRSLPGPDHAASMAPEEFREFVRLIRLTEGALGDGIKRPTDSEKANMPNIRRGVVAARVLAAGTRLSADMITAKRPFGGLEPALGGSLVGLTLKKPLQEDEPITWEHFK